MQLVCAAGVTTQSRDSRPRKPLAIRQSILPVKKGTLIPIVAGVILASVILFLLTRKGDRMGNLEAFPYTAYLAQPLAYEGNTYLMEAQVDQQVGWREGVGKLLVVEAIDGNSRLNVFVPDSLEVNIEPKQRLRLQVSIKTNGKIYVDSVEKL